MRLRRNRRWAAASMLALVMAGTIVTPAGAFELDAATAVPGFDRWAMRAYSKPIDISSEALTFASMALPAALVLEAPREDWASIGAMYAGSLALSWGLKSLGKALVSRDRPYLYFDGVGESGLSSEEGDQSFPSGHAAMAFAGAAFFSSMLCRYCDEPSRKLPLIAASLACAAGASILRVASGNHFPSDVAAGAAIGIFSGLALPWLQARIGGR